MKPVSFPQQTKVLGAPAGHVPNREIGVIIGLPVHATEHQCISCWRPTWRERMSALFFGRVWVAVASPHTQPAIYLQASRAYFEKPDSK